MEILLFSIWLGLMALAGTMVYLAHQSLKKIRKAEKEFRMKH